MSEEEEVQKKSEREMKGKGKEKELYAHKMGWQSLSVCLFVCPSEAPHFTVIYIHMRDSITMEAEVPQGVLRIRDEK